MVCGAVCACVGPRGTFDPANPGPYEHFVYELEQVRPEFRASNTAPLQVPKSSPSFKASKAAAQPFRPWIDPAPPKVQALPPKAKLAPGMVAHGAKQAQDNANVHSRSVPASKQATMGDDMPAPPASPKATSGEGALAPMGVAGQEATAPAQQATAAETVLRVSPNKPTATTQAASNKTDAVLPLFAEGAAHDAVQAPAQCRASASDTDAVAAKPGDSAQLAPVTAMPALDTLDMSVLDQLPAAMRLELMKAYGLHACGATPKRGGGKGGPKPQLSSANKRKPALPARAGSRDSTPSKAHRTGTPFKPVVKGEEGANPASAGKALAGAVPTARAPEGAGARTAEHAVATASAILKAEPLALQPAAAQHAAWTAAAPRIAAQGLTLSQVDPGTLHELPTDVQQNVLTTLPRSRAAFLQRDGPGADPAEGKPSFGNSLVHGLQVRFCSCANACCFLHLWAFWQQPPAHVASWSGQGAILVLHRLERKLAAL